MGLILLLYSSADHTICDHVRRRIIPPQGWVCGCISSLIQFSRFKELNKKSETYAKEGISPAAVRFSADIYVVA